ncbi:MAG: hypothetical protein NPIRA06_28540 [Nitrospirales bacterium]|nr:MAG: hypothetical protein NPIRA06_28540 [Nitrospirales bacterium]
MKSDNRHLLEVLAEQLAAFPIEAHLADDPKIIEDCSAFLRNVIHFWNKYKEEIPSVDALTTIISIDYHNVMGTGSREMRHLININEVNQEALKKVKETLPEDGSFDKLEADDLVNLTDEGLAIDRLINDTIESVIAKTENNLIRLKKTSVKLWNQSSFDSSVIPKGLFVFISHSTKDKDLAVKISKELESIGVMTWRDDKDIVGGDSIPTEIGKGLERATHFTLLYTNTSKNRPWVKTEFENALMLREQTGKLKIIPILLDGLKPPTILGNIKGIPFESFEKGMTSLWQSLGVPARSRISLEILFKFQKRARQALEQVKRCHQENQFWTLELYESEFDELEDIETYFLAFPIRGDETTYRRFEWTMISWPTEHPEEIRPSYEKEFYSRRRAAIAGSRLLNSISDIAERLIVLTEKIEENPLPHAITGGSS